MKDVVGVASVSLVPVVPEEVDVAPEDVSVDEVPVISVFLVPVVPTEDVPVDVSPVVITSVRLPRGTGIVLVMQCTVPASGII